MKRMLELALALAWLGAGMARAAEPVGLAFAGIAVPPAMEIDGEMNRVFAGELAARGIEVHFVSSLAGSSRPEPSAAFCGEARVDRTARANVRSLRGDSPVTEVVSFARCSLSIWRYDAEDPPETLFSDSVVVPLTGDPPELVPAVPVALAERIAAVLDTE
ncbi:MAG: hypothetical protein IK066_01485 [Kiritimatiellae bacterium]|nr:hypothetical protein [Kiritimatiellia bacterium]